MSRRWKNSVWLAALMGFALFASQANAATPKTAGVEGFLTSAGGGAAADGSYAMTFSIYAGSGAKTPLWTETAAKVTVTKGQFHWALGSVNPLDPAKLAATATPFLGVKIGADPELPRRAIHSTLYALHAGTAAKLSCTGCVSGAQLAKGGVSAAAVGFTYAGSATKGGAAQDLACTGCVSVKELKFDADVDLGGNSIKAKNGTFAGGLAASTVTATTFLGDGSKLTGIKTPAGECKVAGEVVKGIKPDGSLNCVKAMDPAALPKDGLNEISNDLLSNQFVDTVSTSQPGVKIPDNQGTEAVSNLTFPNIGVAQTFALYVHVENTDLSKVAITVLPPNDKKKGWTLCDPCGGKDAKVFKKSYTISNKPKVGDIGYWIGKNPQGLWNLKVKDTSFCIVQAPGNSKYCDTKNKKDGWIATWNIKIQTLSNQKIAVKGSQYTTGNVVADGFVHGKKGVQVGYTTETCTAAIHGRLRWHNTWGLQVCTTNIPKSGSTTYMWTAAKPRPILWSGHCNSQPPNNTSWNRYCLDDAEHNTAGGYLSVNKNGIVTVLVSGYYRINFWTIQHGYHAKRLRLLVNGSQRVYIHNDDGDQKWHQASIDQMWYLKKGDTFYIDSHVSHGSRYGWHHGSSSGSHSRMQISYEGKLY